MKPTNEQCEALMRRHDVAGEKEKIHALIREAYRLGRNADVMKTQHKEEVKCDKSPS